jgi:GT2 family glycosyltransferase
MEGFSSMAPLRCASDVESRPTESHKHQLLLLFVAYHPPLNDVQKLSDCLAELSADIGYAVVVNDYKPGEAVDRLRSRAVCFLANQDNPGYGRAVNRLIRELHATPPFLGILNTDLSWSAGTFETLLTWLQTHPNVNLAVPQIVDEQGRVQKLCKQNPTLLGLMSRRFIPERLKPGWLRAYDRHYVMGNQDYNTIFNVPYLSGCCMLVRSGQFAASGGFDERYFLYLEDADLTRTLSRNGRCVHLPVASVIHAWGRGNYRSLRLVVVNLMSAWRYFQKWGWALW